MKHLPRRLVILCDGTGNQIESQQSNVLRLYRVLKRDERQCVFYDPGIGTLGAREDWSRWQGKALQAFGLLTGHGLDENVLDPYRFLMREYQDGDEIFLFGFSRGAYTVRVLAGFIHACGLLHAEQENLLSYAFHAYKKVSDTGEFGPLRLFERILKPHRPAIHFMGLWDSVSSVLVPRRKRLYFPTRRQLPYTQKNPSVQHVRQALALDERRTMFRPYLWPKGQEYWGGPFPPKDSEPALQDSREMWFPGVHSDVGGGYEEAESGLAKLSLRWMLDELDDRLYLHHDRVAQFVNGEASDCVAPDAAAKMHDSLTLAWRVLEYLPQKRSQFSSSGRGWYLPRGQARHLPENAELHSSVRERARDVPSYQPVNLP